MPGKQPTSGTTADYIHPWEVLNTLDKHHPLHIHAIKKTWKCQPPFEKGEKNERKRTHETY